MAELPLRIPMKLERDTIVRAKFELRFEPGHPKEAIFGIVYQIVLEKFPGMTHTLLPPSRRPEELKTNNELFKYLPLNELNGNGLSIGVGPQVVSINIEKPYIGWLNWKPQLMDILNSLCDSHIIKNVERTSLDYHNFIEDDVFTLTKKAVEIIYFNIKPKKTGIRMELSEEGYIEVLNFIDKAAPDIKYKKDKKDVNEQTKKGSIIDIEIFREKIIGNREFKTNLESILDISHTLKNKLFFSILSDDYVKNDLGATFS